jgi:hypothetical protein
MGWSIFSEDIERVLAMNTEEPEEKDSQVPVDGVPDINQEIADEEEEGGLPLPDYGDGSTPDFLWIREDKDQVIVTIYAYKDPQTNRLKSISLQPSYALRDAKMIEFPIESEWTIPTKTQLDDYRSRATRYNVSARGQMMSRAVLEELLIRYHLKNLYFITADNQKSRIELKEGKKGGLSPQSMNLLKSLHSSVMDLLFLKFVDESALLL